MKVENTAVILSQNKVIITAIFSTVTHTRTRALLEKVWLEYESSGINLSMSEVQVWCPQHLLDLSSLECQLVGNFAVIVAR